MSVKSRRSRVEGRSTQVTTDTGNTEQYPKKSAMEIAFGKIKGIMEELKKDEQPIKPLVIQHTNT